jgi:hypothetical protein
MRRQCFIGSSINGSCHHCTLKQNLDLLSLNAFKAHLTPAVLAELRKQKTTLSAIPGGCTGLVQPLDVSINKPLKALIKEEQDNHWDQHLEEWEAGKFNIGDR